MNDQVILDLGALRQRTMNEIIEHLRSQLTPNQRRIYDLNKKLNARTHSSGVPVSTAILAAASRGIG